MASNLVKSLYKNLFGGRAPTDGNLIDMAEHGRAGGVSTGQGHKVIKDVEEPTLIDEVDANTIYMGKTKHGSGTDTSSAIWQVKKILTSGTVTSILFADGNDDYDNIWDDRTSLSYS